MFRSPQIKDIKVHEILRPLAANVWYLIALMYLLFMVALAINFKFEECDSALIRYSNAFLITIGGLCQQGIRIKLRKSKPN